MTIQNFSTDPNSIVNVVVQTIQAPAPNNYQQMGAFVSCGGTTLDPQDYLLLTEYADLAGAIIPAGNVSSIVWATGEVAVTLSAPIPALSNLIGKDVPMVLSGFAPATFNSLVQATIITDTSFTYSAASDPGTPLTYGTAQPQAAVELNQMALTFWAQGPGHSVYVLELGASATVDDEMSSLNTWLNSNPMSFYGYLLPRAWSVDAIAAKKLLDKVLAGYENPEAMTYFWATVNAASSAVIPAEAKCCIKFAEAPSVDPLNGLEFSAAAMFQNAVSFKPTAVTPVSPMAFKYLYGVTPYPTKNNGPTLNGFKANFTNYVATGAEGGVAFYMVYEGVTADGNDYFNWWFTIDWVQINVNTDLSNAIINGSNNPLAPLYYDQDGCNVLLATLAGTMTRGVQLGMVLGQVIQTEYDPQTLSSKIFAEAFAGNCNCNAVPFLTYSLMNPGDYKIGEYDGLSTIFIPKRGFIHVLVTVVASQLVSA